MEKMYLVVEYEPGFYDEEKDYTYLKAVSSDLNSLCEKYKDNPILGDLLIVDSSVFNKTLSLNLSTVYISKENGIEVHDFAGYVRQFYNPKDTKVKTKKHK